MYPTQVIAVMCSLSLQLLVVSHTAAVRILVSGLFSRLPKGVVPKMARRAPHAAAM